MANLPGAMYLTAGAYKDASYQVVSRKDDPKIVLVNLSRSMENRVSYQTYECIKDGLVQSGKYEGGIRLFPHPHVIIFSNFLPDLAALSLDRWDVRYLANNQRQ